MAVTAFVLFGLIFFVNLVLGVNRQRYDVSASQKDIASQGSLDVCQVMLIIS